MTAQPAPMDVLDVGTVRLTFVPDGSIHLPPESMFGPAAQSIFDTHPHLLDAAGDLVLSLGSVLIESSGTRILVDLAWGASTLDLATVPDSHRRGTITGGELLRNLALLGITRSDIDIVVFSHLHADHIGWLTSDSPTGPQLTFERAAYRLAAAEWTYWSERAATGQWGGPTPDQLAILAPLVSPAVDGELLAPGVYISADTGAYPRPRWRGRVLGGRTSLSPW